MLAARGSFRFSGAGMFNDRIAQGETPVNPLLNPALAQGGPGTGQAALARVCAREGYCPGAGCVSGVLFWLFLVIPAERAAQGGPWPPFAGF